MYKNCGYGAILYNIHGDGDNIYDKMMVTLHKSCGEYFYFLPNNLTVIDIDFRFQCRTLVMSDSMRSQTKTA